MEELQKENHFSFNINLTSVKEKAKEDAIKLAGKREVDVAIKSKEIIEKLRINRKVKNCN